MNCLECRELLQRRLDGESIPAQTVEPHLSQCPDCREQHAAAQQLLDALKHDPTPEPSADFAKKMTSLIVEDRDERHDKLRRRVWLTLALAASVIVGLILAYYWIPRPTATENKPNPTIVDNSKKDIPPAPKLDRPKEAPTRVDVPSPLAKLTDRWVDTTRDHAKVLTAVAPLDAVPLPEFPMNPAVRDAGQEVSDGVRSVMRNARRAFDFFARELPMPDLAGEKN
ncbi:MAG: DUF3379 domain-containing protein [Planctomycetes bacterium]|nr:DUF3379 domain-containing protein [Planctomycetota bacterium]